MRKTERLNLNVVMKSAKLTKNSKTTSHDLREIAEIVIRHCHYGLKHACNDFQAIAGMVGISCLNLDGFPIKHLDMFVESVDVADGTNNKIVKSILKRLPSSGELGQYIIVVGRYALLKLRKAS